jgi:hypothetical protein
MLTTPMQYGTKTMAKVKDYAQKARERAIGLGEKKARIVKDGAMKVSRHPANSTASEDYSAQYAELAMQMMHDEMERQRMVVKRLMEEEAMIEEAAKRGSKKYNAKPMLAKAAGKVVHSKLSTSERLDRSMAEFMEDNYGIKVEKRDDPRNLMATYRFIDPSTGDYFDHDIDLRGVIMTEDEETDYRRSMMEMALDYLRKPEVDGRYTDAEGRVFHTKAPEAKAPEPKAPIHREGHFPTHWVEEALDRAEASDKCITLSMERKGVMVVAMEGEDKYSSHVITWEMMEKAEVNPLPLAIEDVEKKLDLLHKIKEKVQ